MKKIGFLILALAVVFVFDNITHADLNDGLVAHYPFNGNANDESGNGNDGTVYGATLTTDRDENPNSAYSFDGNGDYILISDSPSFTFSNEMTISAFIQLSGYGTGKYPRIIEKYDFETNNREWAFEMDSGGHLYHFWSKDGGDVNATYFLTDWVASLNKWYHVAAVLSNGNLKLYVDGEQKLDKTSGITSIHDGSSSVSIGAAYYGNTSYFNGKIDDIRIYNRALSDAEVKELYGGGFEIEITALSPSSQPNSTIQLPYVSKPVAFAGYVRDRDNQPVKDQSFDMEDPISQVSLVGAFSTNNQGYFQYTTDNNQGKSETTTPGLYAFVVYQEGKAIGAINVPVNSKPNVVENDFSFFVDEHLSGVFNRNMSSAESAWLKQVSSSKIPSPSLPDLKIAMREGIDTAIDTQINAFNNWLTPVTIISSVVVGAACFITGGVPCAVGLLLIKGSIVVAEVTGFFDTLEQHELIDDNLPGPIKTGIHTGNVIVNCWGISKANPGALVECPVAAASFVESLQEVTIRENKTITINSTLERSGTNESIEGSLYVLELVDNQGNVYGLSFIASNTKNLIIEDIIFSSGTDLEYIATETITVGPNVTVKNGAKVTFRAPKVEIKSGFHAEVGAVVNIKQQ